MKQKDLQTAEGLLEPFADRIERSRMYANGGRSLIVHFPDGRLRQFYSLGEVKQEVEWIIADRG